MSYRRTRNDWDEFLSRHRTAVQACGIPPWVLADKLRFIVFLDHGYDEWGWAENRHAFFDARILTDDQILALAALVGDHIDERYRHIVASRWTRSR